mgnify:FL=1
MMDNKDIDYLTEEFDEMSSSDLVMWLENHRDTDETCKKMYWDMEYVCKKWVKEMMLDEKIVTHASDFETNPHVDVQPPSLSMKNMDKKLKEFLAISILKTK